jgi:hypothetical protein
MPEAIFRRSTLALLVIVAVVLLAAIALVLGLSALLSVLQDVAVSRVLAWIGLGLAVPFLVDLFCLVLALALNALAQPEEPPEGE